WMLTELFEKLPEVGDLEKPRIVFFFDEAHLLFTDMPKALLQKIVQVVKLIRSKGVGVYFISQNPTDIPDEVLAQLSNRVQHALRAYTPAEQKAVRATAAAFRVNSAFDTQTALMELGVGEALISCLDEKGVPSIVKRALILPPQSLMAKADMARVQGLITSDEFDLKYRQSVDRISAYEILMQASAELEEQQRIDAEEAAAEKQRQKDEAAAEKTAAKAAEAERKAAEKAALAAQKEAEKAAAAKKKLAEKAVNSAATSISNSIGTNLVNSLTGGKITDTGTIAKRAASNALKSVMRNSSSSIIRGLFGNKK
ncbi:MAG: DUF853 family protein, partial [Oscillospiraceae bacterium]|nr:DUF853 family protein [Oscillospiraceae bacterium]